MLESSFSLDSDRQSMNMSQATEDQSFTSLGPTPHSPTEGCVVVLSLTIFNPDVSSQHNLGGKIPDMSGLEEGSREESEREEGC